MKNNRFKYTYRNNASHLHRLVGDLLRSQEMFKSFQVYQEYPVNKVNPSYQDGSHKFDWVVPHLKLVIECHGKQHYQVQNFGMNDEQAVEAFKGIKARDESKRQAAQEAGYKYLIISYKMQGELTAAKLLELIRKIPAPQQQVPPVQNNRQEEFKQRAAQRQKEIREEYLATEEHQNQLKEARERRRQQYQRTKEYKKSLKLDQEDYEYEDVHE
jgi:predicted transcriptional regulator